MTRSTLTGHEDEFRQLFVQEASGRMASIDEHAGALPDPDAAQGLLRHAHTLKGSAAVVGLEEIATILQELELLLIETTRSGVALGADAVDAVRASVARVRALVEAV